MEDLHSTPHSNNQGNLGISGNPDIALTPILPATTALEAFVARVHIPRGYSISTRGTVKYVKDLRGNIAQVVICHQPIGIVARSRDHRSSNWAVRLAWLDSESRVQSRLVPAPVLSQPREFQILAKELASLGILFSPGARTQAMLLEYFFESQCISSMPLERTVGHLGFLANKGQPLKFVLPREALTAPALPGQSVESEQIQFLSSTPVPAHQAYHSKGDLEGWKAAVSPFGDNPLIVASVLFGLMGPFLCLAEEENCGVHFYGSTSCGKTTAAQVCASVAGYPGNPSRGNRQPSLFQTWNTTKNAVEQLLAPHSGMTVIIDEVGANDCGFNLYNAFSGLGKAKLNEEGVLRTQNSWSAFVLSTGEYSCNEHASLKNQGQATAGSMVRMMDVPISDLHNQAQRLDAPQPPDLAVLGPQVEQLQQDILSHYGVALPALIAAFFEEPLPEDRDLAAYIKAELEDTHTALCEHLQEAGISLVAPQRRALRRLALGLVIGSFACEKAVLPFTYEQIEVAVLATAYAWLGSTQFTPIDNQIEETLRAYCLAFPHLLTRDFRQQDSSPSSGVPFLYYADKKLILFSKAQLLRATGQRSITTVIQALSQKDYWCMSKGENRPDPKRPKAADGYIASSRCYMIYADVLFHDFFTSIQDVPPPLDELEPDEVPVPFKI